MTEYGRKSYNPRRIYARMAVKRKRYFRENRGKGEEHTRRTRVEKEVTYGRGAQAHKHKNRRIGMGLRPGCKILVNRCKAEGCRTSPASDEMGAQWRTKI